MKLVDFNYDYMLVSHLKEKVSSLSVKITPDIELEGTYERRFLKGSQKLYLYKINQSETLEQSEEFRTVIKDWIATDGTTNKKKKKNRTFNEWDEFDDLEMLRNMAEE